MKNNDLFLTELTKKIDMRLFTPSLYRYLTEFLKIEKVRRFNDQFVINTFIPPFPSPAFDRFVSTYFRAGQRTPIQSVDLAVTNACMFNCWHCYNAGRLVCDLPTKSLQEIVKQLQDLGAIVINFTGGEPCLRHDLVEICSSLRDDACGILATTGYGFTDEFAKRLADTAVYSISFSLDSADETEHDRKRSSNGAFKIALKGIEMAKRHGFYTYTCAVPSKKLLKEDNFRRLVELNKALGVNELQIIEPAPAGKIASANLDFGEEEFVRIFQYMAEYNQHDNGIAISSFAHMESPEFFGCGAGRSHIYVDGTGEVCPCNMLPVSYGNAAEEDLRDVIARMQSDFKQPYRVCLAHTLQDFFCEHCKAAKPTRADKMPSIPLPGDGELPGFFEIVGNIPNETSGVEEIVRGYDQASATYDDYWLSVASEPINELFNHLEIEPGTSALDCGCGTGYSTALLAERVGATGKVTAIDLTPGMIQRAQRRISDLGFSNVEFKIANVLEELERLRVASYDVAVLTWFIGYVGCEDIFPLLKKVLKPGGKIGFVAHLDRSPRVPLQVFEEIVREDPQSLTKAVTLKFPVDTIETRKHLESSGFRVGWMHQGTFNYCCHSGHQVYDHVMKSGAGTTFYYALKPSVRERFTKEFIRRIDEMYADVPQITIVHEYVVGIGTC